MNSNSSVRSKLVRLLAAGSIVGATLLAPVAAHAAYGPGDPGTGTNGGDNGSGSAAGNNSGDSLPLTGGDALGLTLMGLGAVAGGTALVMAGRRKAVAEV